MSKFDKVQFQLIDENNLGQRIDNYLFTQLKGVPKSRVYRIIRKGEIRVNKKRVKAEYKLQCGDNIRIPPIKISEDKVSVDIGKFNQVKQFENAIIYETNQYILLNKPSGIAVHGGSGLSFGVIEALRALRPKEKFLELVHRLDKDTSGCLLIAKRRSYLLHFQQQLRNRSMQKEYLALVEGEWSKKYNRVAVALKKTQPASGERFVTVDSNGKPSETHFKCIKSKQGVSLIQAFPKTGRTHQIRVHAKYAGCPLIGDNKYNDLNSAIDIIQKVNPTSFFLHAYKLTYTTPDSDEPVTFEAEIPTKMSQAIKLLKLDMTSNQSS